MAPAECAAKSLLIPFDGSAGYETEGLMDSQAAAGWFYHSKGPSLLRRNAFDATDELFVANISLFTVDERSIAWLEGDTLYISPH